MVATRQTRGADFDLDFHAIMHFGDDVALQTHYVPRRSQRTEAVLSFFVQDSETRNLLCANATCAKAGQVIAFAKHWQDATGHPPSLLVFDSKVTTGVGLAELHQAGPRFITLRARTLKVTAALAALPDSAWTQHAGPSRRLQQAAGARTGRHRSWLPGPVTPDRGFADSGTITRH
jgi:hypothetical protein